MIRTLLATTAVAAVLALPVIAQEASSSMESSAMDSSMSSMESSAMDSSMMSSEAPMDSSMMMSSEAPMDSSMMSSEMPMDTSSMVTDTSSAEVVTDTSSMMAEPTGPFDIVTGYTQIDSDRFATRIIGQPVYDGTGTDANTLGNINDIVIDEAGNAVAVTIGVGGFLGIGEKQVAVAYSALSKELAADNTERYVVNTTVEELTAAPEFVVVENDAAGGTVPVPADTMTPAPAANDAMAPSSAAQ